MPWWSGKEVTREYLRKVNEHGKARIHCMNSTGSNEFQVIEYTLFQPGLFLDYLACPYKTAKYVEPLQTVFDYQSCRAMMVDGHKDAIMTVTSVADLAGIVARAVDHEGNWPEIGGIRGNRMTFSEIISIGEKIRGKSDVK